MPGLNFDCLERLVWLIVTVPFLSFVFAFLAMPQRRKKLFLLLAIIPLLLYGCGLVPGFVEETPNQFLRQNFGMTDFDCDRYDHWLLRLGVGLIILCIILLVLGWFEECGHKNRDLSITSPPTSRFTASIIFLAVSAIPVGMLSLFLPLAGLRDIGFFLFHIPYAMIFLVTLFIVPESVHQTQRRLNRTSAWIGLIIGIVDFIVDMADVTFCPWLEKSPYRPLFRIMTTSAICMVVSWRILRRKPLDQVVEPES